jgi:hypothetical protein
MLGLVELLLLLRWLIKVALLAVLLRRLMLMEVL